MESIKNQIKYWEAILKDNKTAIKNLETQNKHIEGHLKFLRAQLEPEEAPEVSPMPDEFSPQ
jgi:hypothetical protein